MFAPQSGVEKITAHVFDPQIFANRVMHGEQESIFRIDHRDLRIHQPGLWSAESNVDFHLPATVPLDDEGLPIPKSKQGTIPDKLDDGWVPGVHIQELTFDE